MLFLLELLAEIDRGELSRYAHKIARYTCNIITDMFLDIFWTNYIQQTLHQLIYRLLFQGIHEYV